MGGEFMGLDEIAGRYEKELLESVIPFWENNCQDIKFGGYFTMLDRDGSVYDTEKYMWMQWRIVYMFATLATTTMTTPEKRKEWIRIASEGFDFLVKNGKDNEGLYYFSLNRSGIPSMTPYSIFSDCFAAMGAAALFKATGDGKYGNEA